MNEQLSKGEQRREQILTWLKQNGRITVQQIVGQFCISEATARRDLEMLEKTSAVIRTLGGALYDGMNTARGEISFTERTSISYLEKEHIAAKAAELVTEGDVIGISGGTTSFLIAKALKGKRGITVVTNAVNIAAELADCEDVQIVVTGGIMRNNSYELCGPLAEKMVESLNIGKMFIGVDGITASQGIMTYSELEAQIGKALIKRAAETYAVFDHTKIGRSSLFSIVPLSELHGVITDAKLPPVLEKALKERNVQVYGPDADRNAAEVHKHSY